MPTLKDVTKTLASDLREAMDLAGDVLPTENYKGDLADAEELLGENPLYRQALEKWGLNFQLSMLASECSELIHTVMESLMLRDGGNAIDLFEELADVEIMCGQMRYIFGDKDIDDWKRLKLERLDRRIKEADNRDG